jgi:hypothetical protein
MPCLKCENGLWKFGKTGKCEYQTKGDCETANADYYSYDHSFEFTEEQMTELHENGQVLVKVKEGEEEMEILFIYKSAENYKKEDVESLAKESTKMTNQYKTYYGIK